MSGPVGGFQREHGLDALRVFAFLVLIFYHSGMGFVAWGWHVKNAEPLEWLEWPMLFANRWRLPLLFFISGAGVAFSLRRRSFGEFANERLRRLLIPLLVAIFVVVPPQIYFERLQRGVSFASYWEFYRTVFDFVPYSKGNTSWHHMWFVAYILFFSLVGIPAFAALRNGRAVARLADLLERMPWSIYLVNVPNLLVATLMGPRWPVTNSLVYDWANLSGTGLTFLWGFVFASDGRLLDLLERRRREFLLVGLAAAALFFGLRPAGVAGIAVSSYLGMAWVFALTGYARAWVTKGSRALAYATEAVYPFYIAHQTITVALVYRLAGVAMVAWVKFAIVAAGTFAGSWVCYEIVRRVGPLRPLFGLKGYRMNSSQ